MTKNNQKIIIILIVVLLMFTSIMAVVISLNTHDDDLNNENSANNNSTNSIRINKEISRLKNYDEYYAINNVINNLYMVELEKDSENIINLLLDDYIINNSITKDNVLDILNISENNVIFYPEEIYYNANSDITYYFIKGYTIEYPLIDGDLKYNDNINYLLIVDNYKNYAIMPLESLDNLEEYANGYDIKEIKIDKNNKFKIEETKETNKISNYITNYTNLMYLNVTKAYKMLDDKTQEKYSSLNSFIANRDSINDRIFTEFKAISTKEQEDYTVYKVQDRNNNTITITEYYPNDYKIGFSFVEGE